MSYPPAQYHGTGGRTSAAYRVARQPPELPMKAGAASYLATGASSHGQFGLYGWDFTGAPSGPAPHYHRSISESFFILAGTVRLFDGNHWIDATPGDFLYVSEGGVHAFRNDSGQPASMLLLFAPGAPREAYFEGLAGLGELTEEEKAEFFLRHDTHWL